MAVCSELQIYFCRGSMRRQRPHNNPKGKGRAPGETIVRFVWFDVSFCLVLSNFVASEKCVPHPAKRDRTRKNETHNETGCTMRAKAMPRPCLHHAKKGRDTSPGLSFCLV